MTETDRSRTWLRFLPGVQVARSYQRQWLGRDLVAGLIVTALLVPQGMAYAELAGLPPVTGLYTTVMALLAYAVFGPSRVLILGPDSSLGPMIVAAILPLIGADGSPERAVALAGMLALLMGAVCVLAGIAKLGRLAELLSKPVRIGFLNGLALIVFVSQLPKLFGFSIDAAGFFAELKAFGQGLADGQTNRTALAIGVASLAVIALLRRFAPKVPGVLVAVVGATAAVGAFGLASHGVNVVGSVPKGFPRPALPQFESGDVLPLLVAAVGMAFVTLADTSALSRAFAAKYGEEVDPDQEIMALGASNLAAGLFQGFAVSASTSRTAVADDAGGQTELVGVVGAASIVILLLFANNLVRNMPQSALAAVVIAASFGLLDLKTPRWLWRVRKTEFLLSITATTGVVVFGVLQGIVVAVLLSLAVFIRRAWHPYTAELGDVPGRSGFHDRNRHPDGAPTVGAVIFRFDGPLFFANADYFESEAKRVLASRPGATTLIVAAEPITDIDTTGAESLADLLGDLKVDGVTLVFAELRGPVRDRLRSYGLYAAIGADHFFDSLDEAVADAGGGS